MPLSPTVNHLFFLNRRSAQQDWKQEKMTGHLRRRPSFQRPAGLRTQRPSFSLLEPSGFFRFCSSIVPGVIFALLLASFLSTTSITNCLLAPTRSQSEWQSEPVLAGLSRRDITASLLNNAEHLQTLFSDLRSAGSFAGDWEKNNGR